MKASPRMTRVVVAAVRPASSEPPKTVSTRKNEAREPTAIASPAGTAKESSERIRWPR